MTDKGVRIAYLFLDESGNLDFSDRGTRYFVLTSVSMVRPFRIYDALDAYKCDCLEYGLENEHFLLAGLESERQWAELFSRPESEELLERLADEALARIKRD